jgi:hypothetical protein
MVAHIFNLDNLLIDIEQKVWIVQKDNPNECLMKISKSDFDLIKSGIFKKDELSLDFNGHTYYLSEKIFNELTKKVKKLATQEELTFSFREFTDPKNIKDIDIKYDLDPIKHLKNSNDHIYLISTKGTDKKYGHYYTELIDKLKEDGILINQMYYLNQSFFSQNKDKNIKKICYVILSNIIGKNIEDDEIGEDNERDYKEVHYYDSNYVTINKIESQINSFLNKLKVDTKKRLILNLVGSNKLKLFKPIEVKLGKRYIKTFENFRK